MTEKIIEILKENETLTECKQYFLVKRKDYQKVANEIESAINYTNSCKSDSEQLVLFADWLQYNGKWSTTEQQVKDFLKEQKEQN